MTSMSESLGNGRSQLETARSLGITFQIAPNIPVEDGIHAVRMLLPRCWFDAVNCQPGLEALQHYRRDYNSRLNEFKATPIRTGTRRNPRFSQNSFRLRTWSERVRART